MWSSFDGETVHSVMRMSVSGEGSGREEGVGGPWSACGHKDLTALLLFTKDYMDQLFNGSSNKPTPKHSSISRTLSFATAVPNPNNPSHLFSH